jgi:hypothetical protein
MRDMSLSSSNLRKTRYSSGRKLNMSTMGTNTNPKDSNMETMSPSPIGRHSSKSKLNTKTKEGAYKMGATK